MARAYEVRSWAVFPFLAENVCFLLSAVNTFREVASRGIEQEKEDSSKN